MNTNDSLCAAAPDMLAALKWLLQYDDTDFGGNDTKRLAEVANWLYAQAYSAELRGIAREMGIPVSKVRAAIVRADCS